MFYFSLSTKLFISKEIAQRGQQIITKLELFIKGSKWGGESYISLCSFSRCIAVMHTNIQNSSKRVFMVIKKKTCDSISPGRWSERHSTYIDRKRIRHRDDRKDIHHRQIGKGIHHRDDRRGIHHRRRWFYTLRRKAPWSEIIRGFYTLFWVHF